MSKQKFTDIELIAALNIHAGSSTRAAEELGVTRDAVQKRKALLPKGALAMDLDTYKKTRADIFADFQRTLLQYVTPEKMKSASLQQIGTLFGIMYDKERLEKNLATEHIAHVMQSKLSEEDKADLRELIAAKTKRMRESISYEE